MSIESAPIPPTSPDSPSLNSDIQPSRKIHKVPLNLRLEKSNDRYIYDPKIVSLGPYHHGKSHLRQMEEFKPKAFSFICSPPEKAFYYQKIYEKIDEIRSCYVDVTKEIYNDETLTEMILLDAFFYIYILRARSQDKYDHNNDEVIKHTGLHVGALTVALSITDLYKLENQIPYWVIKLLLVLKFGEEEGKQLLRYNICYTGLGKISRPSRLPWEDDQEEEPVHILEANQRVLCLPTPLLLEKDDRGSACDFMMNITEKGENDKNKIPGIGRGNSYFRQIHSVTDLKLKGINVRRTRSTCWTDVRFKSNVFSGELQIPRLCIDPSTEVFLHNIIAFEMLPQQSADFSGTLYVNFMKSLIVNSKDVKELRQYGILFHNLGSDEEVVKVFQEIDTVGVISDNLVHVTIAIDDHCNNKAITWVTELINTKFKSPWTVIALFAATFLLILTFLQTYYTIRPVN